MPVLDRCWYCWVKAGKSVKATHLILLDRIEAVCDKCEGDILDTILRQPCSDPMSERRLLDVLAVREVICS